MLIYNKLYFKEGQRARVLSATIINPLGSNLFALDYGFRSNFPPSSNCSPEFFVANMIYVQSDFILPETFCANDGTEEVRNFSVRAIAEATFRGARDIPDDLALTLVFYEFYDFFAVNRKNVNLFMSCSYARGCYGSPSKAANFKTIITLSHKITFITFSVPLFP